MKSVMLRSLAAFDICVLLSSTFFLGGDAGASTPCKDGEFYDSRKGIYRPCEECVGSLQDSCAVCCKAEITDNQKPTSKEESPISKTKESDETDEVRPNVVVAVTLSFFALLMMLVLVLVIIKSARDRAQENRSNRARYNGVVIHEVLTINQGNLPIKQDSSAVQEGTSVCSCDAEVMTTETDIVLGLDTISPERNSCV